MYWSSNPRCWAYLRSNTVLKTYTCTTHNTKHQTHKCTAVCMYYELHTAQVQAPTYTLQSTLKCGGARICTYQSLEGKVALFLCALLHNVKHSIQGVLWELQYHACRYMRQHIIKLTSKCYHFMNTMARFLEHVQLHLMLILLETLYAVLTFKMASPGILLTAISTSANSCLCLCHLCSLSSSTAEETATANQPRAI